MVAAAVSVIHAASLFWRKTIVMFSVLGVVVTSLAAFSLLAASVLVVVSGSWAVLLSLAVPLPPLFLLFLFYLCGSV